MNMRNFFLFLMCSFLGQSLKAQNFSHFYRGKGLIFNDDFPLIYSAGRNQIWPAMGLPFPPVLFKNDSSFLYFKPETNLNPYSNPLVGAYVWQGKSILLTGFLPAYTMGIFGQCNGGVLMKTGNQFALKNSLNTPSLASVNEKFWYHSAKPRLDSSVWIAADTGFRRLNLNSLETKILKGDQYKGIALYNRMAAFGNRWAGFRNDFGMWCLVWGDTSAKLLSGLDLGLGPNRFVFDIAETPGNDTLFTASDFLGNLQSPYRLYKRNQGQNQDLSAQFPILGDSLTFLETEQDGTIWVCGRKREIFQIRNGKVRKVLLPDSLQQTPISQLVIDEGNFKWIGLKDRGLLRLGDVSISPVLPSGKQICMGDTFLFRSGATTIGTGILKVKWDFGMGDTLSGLAVRYAPRRPGTYGFTVTVLDSNGFFQQFSDSLKVDYPVGSLIQTNDPSPLLCRSRILRHGSPFKSSWILPSGNRIEADSLETQGEGLYRLVIENGKCIFIDSILFLPGSALNLKIQYQLEGKEVSEPLLYMPLPRKLSISATPTQICQTQWYENGNGAGQEISIERQIEKEGIYVYKIEGEYDGGCKALGMDTLWIKDLETMVPNLVTGNGDGKNDLLNIEALSFYPENELVIFNRWGKEVFSASPYQNNWPSADVQPGTYFYRLQAGGKSVTGWVMVGR
jgi:gliding motility-associated-like protein